MSLSPRYLALLFVASACLSRPTFHGSDGGADAVDSIDASDGVDADSADAAGSDAPFDANRDGGGSGESFPPTSTAVTITGGWSGDLDGDDIDDVILLSDTGDSASAGVYVLYGQSGRGLPDYQAFLGTGDRDPLAAAGIQLDGAAGVDIVVFAVDYGVQPMYEDNTSYLMGYLTDGQQIGNAMVNHITAGGQQNHLFPRTEDLPAMVVPMRLTPGAAVPTVAVMHQRGAFMLTLTSWSVSAFTSTPADVLLASYGARGAGTFPSAANAGADDIAVYTDDMPSTAWMTNDGAGNLTRIDSDGTVPGITYGALYELNGAAPPELFGVRLSGVQVSPIDDDGGTSGALLDGMNYITGYDNAAGILAFESHTAGDGRPELVLPMADCTNNGGEACLLMLPNARIDGGSGNLISDSKRSRALPSGFVPALLARGDFDGDGATELRVFASDGSQQCATLIDGVFGDCP